MKVPKSLVRAWLGIALAAVLCLSSSLNFFSTLTAYYEQQPDITTLARQERRLARLRAELPPGSVLGYFTDLPAHQTVHLVAFYTVSYVLAPNLVVAESAPYKPKLVVGNFSQPPDFGQLERESGLKLIKDYGGGVMLFQREGN